MTAIYKVVRSIKLVNHGWIKTGRFVECRPVFAKNHVIRRELIRCFAASKDSAESVNALWIDTEPNPVQKKEKEMVDISPGFLESKTKQTKNKTKKQRAK